MIIHSVESLAALDGDGIRYAVYFTGCPLRCVYCHNVDTWINAGTEYTAEAISKKIIRCIPYFGENGGATFSGGEPLLHAKDINEIYSYLQKENVGYDLDTSGAVDLTDDVKKTVDNADLVILDIKFPNEEEYLKYTKHTMKTTLHFLDYLEQTNKRTWIRTVIVPSINNTKSKIDEYYNVVKGYTCIEKYELLAFHTMGFFKYEKLDIENPLKDTPALDQKELKELQEYLNNKMSNK